MIKQCFLFQAEDSHVTGAPGVVRVQELRALDVGMYDGDSRDSQRHLFLIQERLLVCICIGLQSF